MKSQWVRQEALGIIAIQSIFVFLLTFFVMIGWGLSIGGSFLLGGLIAPLANSYFCFRAFSYVGARAAKRIVVAFYKGEAIKMLMSAVGFYVAFSTPWVSPLWVFIGYIAAQIGFIWGAVSKSKKSVGMKAR